MMQAKKNFDDSISEVAYLNNKSKTDTNGDKIYFKVIILLLCAKLEKFVKDSINEYIDSLLSKSLTKEQLPETFVLEIIKNELLKVEDMKIEKYITDERCKDRAKVFSLIWDTKYILKHITKSEFVVSISNNGTNAFENAYKKIGFPNIIKSLPDYEQQTDMVDVTTSVSHSICNTINKIIAMRNKIIHDDATPSVTINDVDLFVAICTDFVTKIDAILTESLASF